MLHQCTHRQTTGLEWMKWWDECKCLHRRTHCNVCKGNYYSNDKVYYYVEWVSNQIFVDAPCASMLVLWARNKEGKLCSHKVKKSKMYFPLFSLTCCLFSGEKRSNKLIVYPYQTSSFKCDCSIPGWYLEAVLIALLLPELYTNLNPSR